LNKAVDESTASLGNVTGLAVSGVPTQNSIAITWNAVTDATSYDVLVNGSLHANVTGTSRTITGLTASTQYTITVRAKNATVTASGASITATTGAVPTASLATTGLNFYYNARDG